MKNRETTVDVVRAWKDPVYRASLSSNELARIPASPVGMSEIDPNELGEVVGAAGPGSRKKTRCKCCGLVTRQATKSLCCPKEF